MKVVTGIAIKGSDASLKIGGADAPVIKNPIDGLPYIPGSSLKGKLRTLCELKKGHKEPNPCGCGDCMVCKVFGSHNIKTKKDPTRIIVRDGVLSEESKELIANRDPEEGKYLEDKAEILMDRKTGAVKGGGLRTMERVPAGLSFNVEIVLQIFDGDNEEEMKKYIDDALKMLEDNYLGGSGSRGYGQVKFDGSWN